MIKATKFELRFLKKEKLAKNTYSFYFDRVKRGSAGYFDFIPGQYLKLYLPIENPDARGTSRYFTISSSPTDQSFLTITTKIVKSSFKLKLKSLKPGDRINAFGPIGYFNFNTKNRKRKVFLAGGIGITPYHSILRYIDSKKLDIRATLIVSFPSRDEVIFFEELKKIESRNPNIRVIYTLTSDDNMYPEFEKGRINASMIEKYTQDKDSEFFIVGSEAYETSAIETVRKLGIAKENILTENFPGY